MHAQKYIEAMGTMNRILDLYVDIEALGFSPLAIDADDDYINARHFAHVFLTSLLEKLSLDENKAPANAN
ncbi:hypothetical protein [Fluviispira vulneris]|uniref:hypothetical protein n=1 Tax=Fluviispira vulneris TaxID=2763012 RepID=UPI001648038B|nr:hypothetical protein [Fluviispira vulneris]